jgi:hypothetical protein
VFLAPLLAVLVGVASAYLPAWTGIKAIYVVSSAFALSFWILVGMGPDLKVWRLTGNHRITRKVFQQREMVRTA